MIEYGVTILILFIVAAYYKLFYQPKRFLKQYKDKLQGLGYKVKLYPYQILGSPIINQFFDDQKKHNDSFYTYKKENTQYDLLLLNTLNIPTIQLLSPELLQSFYQPENVYVHEKMGLMIQNIRRSLGHGIAFSEGKQWKRKRGIMNAVFNYDFIIESIPKIVKVSQENLVLQEQECKKQGKMEEIDGKKQFKMRIFQLFAGTFSNVMLQCFFGCNSTHEKINNESVATFINSLNTDITQQNFELPVLLFGTKFVELGLRQKDRSINERIKLLRQFGNKLIVKRLSDLQKQGPKQNYKDIIQALVLKKSFDSSKSSQKVKVSKIDAENYDFKELIDQFCTFFTAGTDTTSHFTQMMIYYISMDKRIEQKLRKQIDEVIKTDEDITKENLKKLEYIDWIQNETTRYYGPGNGIFTRIAQKDHYIANIPIHKGMAINVQPTASHFNEKYYKNPNEFRPQRWQTQCKNLPGFAFAGFGGGPRTCIGRHLAMLESKIAVIKFMKRYQSFALPKKDFKMCTKFLYEAEPMEMTLIA